MLTTIQKKFLGDIDTGVKTFKNIYSIVAPVLDSYGVNASNNNYISKALTGYDNIRNNVIQNHDRVMNDINTVKTNLSNKNVKFDLI